MNDKTTAATGTPVQEELVVPPKLEWLVHGSSSTKGRWYLLVECTTTKALFSSRNRYSQKRKCVSDAKSVRKHLDAGNRLARGRWNRFVLADSVAKARAGIQFTL